MLTLITLMLCGVMLFFTIVTHWRWENILFSNMEGDHTFELPIQVIFIEVSLLHLAWLEQFGFQLLSFISRLFRL